MHINRYYRERNVFRSAYRRAPVLTTSFSPDVGRRSSCFHRVSLRKRLFQLEERETRSSARETSQERGNLSPWLMHRDTATYLPHTRPRDFYAKTTPATFRAFPKLYFPAFLVAMHVLCWIENRGGEGRGGSFRGDVVRITTSRGYPEDKETRVFLASPCFTPRRWVLDPGYWFLDAGSQLFPLFTIRARVFAHSRENA